MPARRQECCAGTSHACRSLAAQYNRDSLCAQLPFYQASHTHVEVLNSCSFKDSPISCMKVIPPPLLPEISTLPYLSCSLPCPSSSLHDLRTPSVAQCRESAPGGPVSWSCWQCQRVQRNVLHAVQNSHSSPGQLLRHGLTSPGSGCKLSSGWRMPGRTE